MVPMGNGDGIHELAHTLACKVPSFPIKYLGLPLGAKMQEVGIWNPIITKMEKKFSSWKRNTLSKWARLTVIKTALSSLPIYFLFLSPF